jgi:hypothetical protein
VSRLTHLFILLFISSSAGAVDLSKFVVTSEFEECRILHTAESADFLPALLAVAVTRGCHVIRIEAGEWFVDQPIEFLESSSALTIQANSTKPVLRSRSGSLMRIRKCANLRFEDLILEGAVELEQTENIHFRGIAFRRGGLSLGGKKCNQPNECTDYNRRLQVEDCVFENCFRGIRAERLENSRIERNRFIGNPSACAPETIGIELDGSSEDVDRLLELGHSKGNQIIQNSFEQEGSIGIRIRDSWANVIRENHFRRSYRALEFQEGARHNQVLQSYITYLSQQFFSGACPSPCGIYLGAGSVNNIFWNNFFEQNFELQFLESNRNRTYVIDESGQQNVFRSDFLRIR